MKYNTKINTNDDFLYVDFQLLSSYNNDTYQYNSNNLLMNRDDNDTRLLIDDMLYIKEELIRKYVGDYATKLIDDNTVYLYHTATQDSLNIDKYTKRICIPHVISSYDLPDITLFKMNNISVYNNNVFSYIDYNAYYPWYASNINTSQMFCDNALTQLDDDQYICALKGTDWYQSDYLNYFKSLNATLQHEAETINSNIDYSSEKMLNSINIKQGEILLNKIKYKRVNDIFSFSTLNASNIKYTKNSINQLYSSANGGTKTFENYTEDNDWTNVRSIYYTYFNDTDNDYYATSNCIIQSEMIANLAESECPTIQFKIAQYLKTNQIKIYIPIHISVNSENTSICNDTYITAHTIKNNTPIDIYKIMYEKIMYVKNNLTDMISNTYNDKFCSIAIDTNLNNIFTLIPV